MIKYVVPRYCSQLLKVKWIVQDVVNGDITVPQNYPGLVGSETWRF
jgi:hypothetical protein